MKKSVLILFLIFISAGLFPNLWAQSKLLQSGPMVGYSEMREVMLWAQTTESAKVRIEYWVKGKKGKTLHSNVVSTRKDQAFTAHLLCDEVMPGNSYRYAVFINDQKIELPYELSFQTQALWQYRTDPPNFQFAIGSCNFVNDSPFDRPGEPYGGEYEIFPSILEKSPEFMIWLGDNTYLREADWNTRTGIHYRNTHTRSLPEMQALLASVHHYAIWDDHDFGPNDADRSFIHKDKTLEAFKLFWANTSYGIDGQAGITGQFHWSDCDFFMLDNRWNRAPNHRVTGDRTILGKDQLQWIIDALKNSRSPFKFVSIGGQVLNTAPVYENYINVAPKERKQLLDAIKKEKIKGVIFLTGDRHHSELTQLTTDDNIQISDLTISPLTSNFYDTESEPNILRVKDTHVAERNYAILEVTGLRKERVVKITVYNVKGEEVWSREIKSE